MAHTPREIVNQQAEDEGLWFVAEHAPEAYLQHALRILHDAVETFDSETVRQRDLLLEAAKVTIAQICPTKRHNKPTTKAGQHIHEAVCPVADLYAAIAVTEPAATEAS